jgi:signal transduction histidine kinase
MKLFITTTLLFLMPVFSTAQNPLFTVIPKSQVDSFKSLLKITSNDTLRMEIFRKLSIYYLEVKRDSSLYYAEQRLAAANQLRLKLWQVEGYDMLGVVYNYLGNYPKSLQAFLQGLQIAEDEESEEDIWRISQFTLNGNPRDARLNALAAILLDMGNLYGRTANIDKQISSYYRGIAIGESIKDFTVLSLLNMNLGAAYLTLNKLDSALIVEQQALGYSDSAGFFAYRGQILSNLGSIYFKNSDHHSAKKYFTESIQTSEEQNNYADLGVAYISLANLYLQTGMVDSSLYYARKGLENYKIVGAPDGMSNVFTCLYSIYKSQNNTDSALHYLQLATAEKDSLYNTEKAKQFQNIGFDEQLRMQELEKEKIEAQNKIRTYTMLAGIAVFMVIAFLLYRNNRNRRKANTLLKQQKDKIENTLTKLKSTQSQLIQSEKMASLGELTAGIAHEIQNPLNFVNNFSELSNELIDEMNVELEKGDLVEAKFIAADIKTNLQKINHHGKRAESIVTGMLQHSKSSSGQKELTDINKLADEYLRLSYHGLRAKDKEFNCEIITDFDASIGHINIISQDIGRVLLNLINNAFYACAERSRSAVNDKQKVCQAELVEANPPYKPAVSLTTKKFENNIEVSVADNGPGIPQKIVDKIFQPFFTTKPTGQGTGLGLSLAYDIVKAHGGELKVETKEEEGSTFIIHLPTA